MSATAAAAAAVAASWSLLLPTWLRVISLVLHWSESNVYRLHSDHGKVAARLTSNEKNEENVHNDRLHRRRSFVSDVILLLDGEGRRASDSSPRVICINRRYIRQLLNYGRDGSRFSLDILHAAWKMISRDVTFRRDFYDARDVMVQSVNFQVNVTPVWQNIG